MEAGRAGGDLFGEAGTFVTVGSGKTDLHKLMGRKQALEFGQNGFGDARLSDHETGIQPLADTAKVGLLRSIENGKIHWGMENGKPG
jgi:hypothetical protein